MRFCAAEILLIAFCSAAAAAERLPGYAAERASFTVSGVSSGGYLAVQMQVAHSSRVIGVGALAAGPYYCAQGSLWSALNNCMTPGTWSQLPETQVLRAHVDRLARERQIDPIGNIAGARVWLFSGLQDKTVLTDVVDGLRAFYTSFGAKVRFVKDQPAGHGMVTEHAGSPCGATRSPFINDCNYDAAGELLRHVLGSLSGAAAKPEGRLLTFDQREFGGEHAISMADEGYAYVPRACEREPCRIHVAFHGCRQGAHAIGERFVREAGYNRWADTNRLIVLYPQAIARYFWVYNPRGCWDWWGYTGPRYATKEGAQIRAVLGMVERLGQPRK